MVLLDTNLLLLLVVGRADRSYLASHKRTQDFDAVDLDAVEGLIAAYDGLVTTPHVLAETSNLLRQTANPARDLLQRELQSFILECKELPIASREGCNHEQYLPLGLTDAVVLTACEAIELSEGIVELLTADEPIYNRARSRGLPAELYA